MKWGCLLFFFMMCGSVFAQEEEYYKTPGKRKLSYEVVNLPYLDSKFTSFYVGTSGAFRRNYVYESAEFSKFGTRNKSINEWLELNLGLNIDNNYFVETGIVRLKNQLSANVYASKDYPGFGIGIHNRQTYVPILLKKKIVSLNKVTKNAQFNMGIGTGFLVDTKGYMPNKEVFDFQEIINSTNLDYFDVTLSHAKRLMYSEVNAEVKGNITDRFELLVFIKGMVQPQHKMEIEFDIGYHAPRSKQSYIVFERDMSVILGIQARLNSRKFYKYSSKI